MNDSHSTAIISQLILSGIAFGSVYAMVAIGFNIIYNATGIINFAQGEFVMLGGMFIVWAHTALSLPIWAALPVAIVIVTVIGIVFERTAIHPVKNPTVLNLIIITIGGSFLLRGVALLIWGNDYYSLRSFLGDESVYILGAMVTRQHILVFAMLIVVALLLGLFFGYTITGKAMRACSYNRTAARLMGINPEFMVMLAFGMSAAIGALAGATIIPITGVEYDNGALLGLKGFCAAVLGGLGNNTAAIFAGVILGVLESLSAGYISSHYKDALALGVLLVVLFIRPSGLFGKAEISRLSKF